jgi:hypothetical protein
MRLLVNPRRCVLGPTAFTSRMHKTFRLAISRFYRRVIINRFLNHGLYQLLAIFVQGVATASDLAFSKVFLSARLSLLIWLICSVTVTTRHTEFT